MISKNTTTFTFDSMGNVLTSETKSGIKEGEYIITRVQNTYSDSIPEFTNNYILGRLASSSIQTRSSSKEGAVYNSSYQYSETNGQLTKEVTFDARNEISLTKEYFYNLFGNIDS